jgi:hypothetical protein
VSFGRQTRQHMNIIVSEEDSRRQVEGFPLALRSQTTATGGPVTQTSPIAISESTMSGNPALPDIAYQSAFRAHHLFGYSRAPPQEQMLSNPQVIRGWYEAFGGSPWDCGSNEHRRG